MWDSSEEHPKVFLRSCAEPSGRRGCLAHGKSSQIICGMNGRPSGWNGLGEGGAGTVRPREQTEGRSEPHLQPEWQPLCWNTTKTGLGKDRSTPGASDVTSFRAVRKKGCIWTHGKIWTGCITTTVPVFHLLFECQLYFLPQLSGFLHAFEQESLCPVTSGIHPQGKLLHPLSVQQDWNVPHSPEPSQMTTTATRGGYHDWPSFGQMPTHGVTKWQLSFKPQGWFWGKDISQRMGTLFPNERKGAGRSNIPWALYGDKQLVRW